MQHVQGRGYYQSKGHGEGEGRMKKSATKQNTDNEKECYIRQLQILARFTKTKCG